MSPRDVFGFLFLAACMVIAYVLVRTEQPERRSNAADAQLSAASSSGDADTVDQNSLATAVDGASSSLPTVRLDDAAKEPAAPGESDLTRLCPQPPSRPSFMNDNKAEPPRLICNYDLRIRDMLRSIRAPGAGDLNNDGVVGLDDLAAQLSTFGKSAEAQYADGDIDSDGDVDEDDIAILVENLGTSSVPFALPRD